MTLKGGSLFWKNFEDRVVARICAEFHRLERRNEKLTKLVEKLKTRDIYNCTKCKMLFDIHDGYQCDNCYSPICNDIECKNEMNTCWNCKQVVCCRIEKCTGCEKYLCLFCEHNPTKCLELP